MWGGSDDERAVGAIARKHVVDPIGPEFMAPPARDGSDAAFRHSA